MLIICPTPLGNIRDISLRVLEVLGKADIIACEDTRVAGKLLTLIHQKKIREQFSVYETGETLPAEPFEDQVLFGESVNESNAEEFSKEHPNMF